MSRGKISLMNSYGFGHMNVFSDWIVLSDPAANINMSDVSLGPFECEDKCAVNTCLWGDWWLRSWSKHDRIARPIGNAKATGLQVHLWKHWQFVTHDSVPPFLTWKTCQSKNVPVNKECKAEYSLEGLLSSNLGFVVLDKVKYSKEVYLFI